MLFGIYLVENGVITCEEFYEALKLQLRSRPQLGSVAIEKRKLNMRQVLSVLRNQCESPADLFGEIAVKLGYMNSDDLAVLVQEQTQRLKPFSKVLIEAEILPAEVVDLHVREYRAVMEQSDEVQCAIVSC